MVCHLILFILRRSDILSFLLWQGLSSYPLLPWQSLPINALHYDLTITIIFQRVPYLTCRRSSCSQWWSCSWALVQTFGQWWTFSLWCLDERLSRTTVLLAIAGPLSGWGCALLSCTWSQWVNTVSGINNNKWTRCIITVTGVNNTSTLSQQLLTSLQVSCVQNRKLHYLHAYYCWRVFYYLFSQRKKCVLTCTIITTAHVLGVRTGYEHQQLCLSLLMSSTVMSAAASIDKMSCKTQQHTCEESVPSLPLTWTITDQKNVCHHC